MKKNVLFILFVVGSLGITTYMNAQTAPKKKKKEEDGE